MEDIIISYSDVVDFSNGDHAIYLRKSRADVEAEARGEGETLARHLKILLELARKTKIRIGKIYYEIVSGESIADRPQIQELLEDVKLTRWKGVLVVEVERLARGNTKDQGIVAEAFSISSTKIVTPIKVYDPDNEYDEEYFEFGLFMSRREYKVINRRLQRGRLASVNEGKYVGSVAPFGWDKVKIKNDSGYTLGVNSETKTVQIAFDLYAYNDISLGDLAKQLDSRGLKPRKTKKWKVSTIRDMLRNPVHIGMIKWKAREEKKEYKNGTVKKTRPRNKNHILVKGLHSAIIKKEVWDMVQQKLNTHKAPVQENNVVKNPLAGLVRCSKCGSIMQRRPYNAKGWDDTLICQNNECDNVSSKLYIVENKIISSLREWLKEYKIDFQENINAIENQKIMMSEKAIKELEKELEIQNKKLSNVYDFFEDGTYTKEMFVERSRCISEQITNIKTNIEKQEKEISEENIRTENKKKIIPQVENVIDLYDTLETPEEKNLLLKTVVKEIKYLKTEKSIKKNSDPTNFELDIYPKVG